MLLEIGIAFRMGKGLFTRWIFTTIKICMCSYFASIFMWFYESISEVITFKMFGLIVNTDQETFFKDIKSNLFIFIFKGIELLV